MKINRLKPNLTEVTSSSGIVVLFFGSAAVAARMKDGRFIEPDNHHPKSGLKLNTHFTVAAKEEAIKWWIERGVYSGDIQTINTKVFKTLVEGI